MDWLHLQGEAVVQQLQHPSEVYKKRARLQLTFVRGEYEDEDGDTATGFFLADVPPRAGGTRFGCCSLDTDRASSHAAGLGEVDTCAGCEMGVCFSRDVGDSAAQSSRATCRIPSSSRKDIRLHPDRGASASAASSTGAVDLNRKRHHEQDEVGDIPLHDEVFPQDEVGDIPLHDEEPPHDEAGDRRGEELPELPLRDEELPELPLRDEELPEFVAVQDDELHTGHSVSDEEMTDAQFTCDYCCESLSMALLGPTLSCTCLFCVSCLRQHIDATLGSAFASCSNQSSDVKVTSEPSSSAATDSGNGQLAEAFSSSAAFEWITCPTPKCGGCLNLLDAQSVAPESFRKWEDKASSEFLDQSTSFGHCPGCGIFIEKVAGELPQNGAPENGGIRLSKAALRHKAVNRFRCPMCTVDFCGKCTRKPYHEGKTCEQYEEEISSVKCIFCEGIVRSSSSESRRLKKLESMSVKQLRDEVERSDVDIAWCVEKRELVQVQNLASAVCSGRDCRKLLKLSCSRILECGHRCGGVRAELTCLPCLEDGCHSNPCAGQKVLTSGDELCAICMVDPIRRAPAIVLTCGHVVHSHCAKKKIDEGFPGPEISFGFLECAQCSQVMEHPTLRPHAWKHEKLRLLVRQRIGERLKIERMEEQRLKLGASSKPSRWTVDKSRADKANVEVTEELVSDAMKKYQYYVCCKCKEPYFGGMRDCRVRNEREDGYDPGELMCGGCSAALVGKGKCKVANHGTDYMEYKCKYCCSVATFFCYGTTHFCNSCHLSRERGINLKQGIVNCKGPKHCPLRTEHAPNGEESCLGCSLCRIQGQ